MSYRTFSRLETTHRQDLEIGTRIWHKDDWGKISEGVITKMQECDSGILLYLRTDLGETTHVHVQSFIPHGVAMDNFGNHTKIITDAPHQMELRGVAAS